jgi:uncharacterized protein YndB with AHSA1/START domain
MPSERLPLKDHVVSIDIHVPRQQVWEEITKLGKVQRSVMNTLLESTLKPGAKLRYYSPDKKRVFVVGEVVEITPPRKFTHTYRLLMHNESPSLVTWELTDIPGGCRVTITHSGWTDQVKQHKGVAGGWRQILGALKQELETGQLPFMTRLVWGVMGTMMFMLPKATKVEEVEKAGW